MVDRPILKLISITPGWDAQRLFGTSDKCNVFTIRKV